MCYAVIVLLPPRFFWDFCCPAHGALIWFSIAALVSPHRLLQKTSVISEFVIDFFLVKVMS